MVILLIKTLNNIKFDARDGTAIGVCEEELSS